MTQQDSVLMRTFWRGMAGLCGLVLVTTFTARSAFAEDPRMAASIEERIKPVGQVRTGPITAAAAASSSAGAAKVDAAGTYQSACFACHGTGAAGAPKLGDAAAWGPRISKGKDTLYGHAINGFNAMPPKGGNASLSDDTVKAIVDYMVSKGQ